MNYSKLQKAEAIPEAASMIETLRAIGYSLRTAIADIIDNSIAANAKKSTLTVFGEVGNLSLP